MKQSVSTQHLIEFEKLHDLAVRNSHHQKIVSEITKVNHTAVAVHSTVNNYGLGLTLNICKCYDTFVNYNWVSTRWQQYSTYLQTNNTQNVLSVLWVAYATHSTLKPFPTLPR